MKRHSSITVIGGGVAGVGTALALARAGYNVRLIERGRLLSATSNHTPGRLGLGFHYATPDTAAMLFDTSMDLVRRFPGCTLGRELPFGHPLRRALYFIARDSLFAPDDIAAVHAMLNERYAQAWFQTGGNLPFGLPQDFLRPMKESEYRDHVDTRQVVAGVDTAEVLLDWPEVRERLRRSVCLHPCIEIVEHEEVEAIERLGQFDFSIATRRRDTVRSIYRTEMIVNCAWQNIDRINQLAGLPIHSGAINRLKVLLEARLPPQLVNRSSMFFCMGPFAMFSNMNNGHGMMTYAPVTNVESFEAGDAVGEEIMDAALRGGIPGSECQRLAHALQEGVTRFIPAMRNAEPVCTKFGVVRTRGACDLWDRNSDVHHRDYRGVAEEAPDVISNAAIKLIYFARNADQIVDMVSRRLPAQPGRVKAYAAELV